MEEYKREFIDFMMECGVLRFGSFTTKSGRQTPFFINTGYYRTGSQLRRLGGYYARAIHEHFGDELDVLFGPAYKGIPLSVTAAIALSELYGTEVRTLSDRKEAKDHGEKGAFLGAPPVDGERVLIIEDVTTAGTSIRETVPLLREAAHVQLQGLIVSVDRMERGTTDEGALQEAGRVWGMKTAAIVTMAEVLEYLDEKGMDPQLRADIEAYYRQYGARKASI